MTKNKLKLLYILNFLTDFQSGCHFYRVLLPSNGLGELGHEKRYMTHNYDDNNLEDIVNWADIVCFSRAYGDETKMNDLLVLCKKLNKKIAYDLDDDVWSIIKENPATISENKLKQCAETIMEKADLVTTTTEPLKKVLEQFNENVVIVENAIDKDIFKCFEKSKDKLPVVLYSGGASHWKDMLTILPSLCKVKKEIPFMFVLLGFCQSPIESTMYEYNKLLKWGGENILNNFQKTALECWDYLRKMDIVHFPYYTPELYPIMISKINADIGLCPVEDIEFNKSKSAIKFYEYASCGMATLAPALLPYKDEVDYTYTDANDFENKLKKLLQDYDFRKEVATRQREWVLNNREAKIIIPKWEKAYLDILNK